MPSLLSFFRQRSTAVALLVAGAFFMENLDGTIIATALPRMARDFGSTPEALAIGMTAYLLTLAVFIPASGWLADRLGARRVFGFAIVGFTIASVLCGASTGVVSFTLARILQGAAGALMVPVGRLVVLRGTERRDLMRAIATLTWPALTAPVLGPPLGGFITHAFSWRWIFFINVPLGIVAFGLTLVLIGRQKGEEPRPFDGLGFLLNGTSLACLLFALDRFGEAGADGVTAAIVLGVSVLLGAVALRHARRHVFPLVPLDAFGNLPFAITMRAGSISRTTISTMPFLLPLLFQVGLELDAFAAGLLVLWYGVANLAIKPFTSAILRRFGFRTVLLANTLVNAAAIASCAVITRATPVVLTASLLMVAGAARSMQFTALNTLAFAELPPRQTGAANTLFNMAFQLAVGLGVALGAIVLRLVHALPASGIAHGPDWPFHVAFLLVGALALTAWRDYTRLALDAGAAVSGQALRTKRA